MEKTIIIDSCEDYDLQGNPTGIIEQAGITFIEEFEPEDLEVFKLYDSPCLVFRQFDQRLSDISGFAMLEDKLVLKLSKSDSVRAKKYFDKYGL